MITSACLAFAMSARPSQSSQRPRELRRRVVLPARLRAGASWSDTCILNISSRGMMIHSGHPLTEGARVELRRGDHVMEARVVWRDGSRLGLQSEERLPVDEILSLSQSQALQITAGEAAKGERRKHLRPCQDDSRLRARALQFASVGVIACTLAISAAAMVQQPFARPLDLVQEALGERPQS